MNIQSYESHIANLKFGEGVYCDMDICEICASKLEKFITPSNPIWIVKKQAEHKRVCFSCFFMKKKI